MNTPETPSPAAAEPDVTITSYMDTPAQMREALGLAPDEDADDDAPEVEPDTDGQDTEDGPDDAERAAATAATDEGDEGDGEPEPATGANGLEVAPERETRRQRVERLERNLQRVVGASVERTAALEREIRALTSALERATAGGRETTERTASPAPAADVTPFSFPSWETWADEHPDATEDDYRDARTDARDDWKREKALAERRVTDREAAQREVSAEVAQIVETKRAGIEAFKGKHADFDDVLAASTAVLTPGLHAYASRAGEVGAAMVYHLSRPENAALAATFATMRTNSPEEMRALVRLEESAEVKALLKGTRPSGSRRTAGATRHAESGRDTGTERSSRPRPRSSPPPEPLDTQVPGRGVVSTVPLDGLDTDAYIATANARDPRRIHHLQGQARR